MHRKDIMSDAHPSKNSFIQEIMDCSENEIDYLHTLPNIQNQIAEYKKIYLQAKNTYPNIFDTNPTASNRQALNLHIDGLFAIFKRALYQVMMRITETNENSIDLTAIKKSFKDLYTIASRLEANKNLGINFFLKLNLMMSIIYDMQYETKKGDQSPNNLLIKDIIENRVVNTLQRYASPFYDEDYINKTLAKNNLSGLIGTTEVFPVTGRFHFPYVLYSQNGSQLKSISPKTFINCHFDNKTPGNLFLYHLNIKTSAVLAFFASGYTNRKISKEQKKEIDEAHKKFANSKADPHFGVYNHTNGILVHDFLHAREQALVNNNYSKGNNSDMDNDILSLLKSIPHWENNPHVINAVFILIHELFPFFQKQIVGELYTRLKIGPEFFDLIKEKIKKFTESERDIYYKANYKDLEFILKVLTPENQNEIKKRMDGVPTRESYDSNKNKNFFSLWQGANKQKAVSIGYEIFWDEFNNKYVKK